MWRGPTALARLTTAICAMAVVGVLAFFPPSRFCVPLNVAASNEKSSLLAIVAQDYEAGRPPRDGRWVQGSVVRLRSGGAAGELVRGWEEVSEGAAIPAVWSRA